MLHLPRVYVCASNHQPTSTGVFRGYENQSFTLRAVLAKYLGGRSQEFNTPEVAKRLQEITVDPKTVKTVTDPSDK